MKAVGFTTSLPIENEASLVDFDLPVPEPGPRDLLVKVAAASVNPADAKRRSRFALNRILEQPVVLGFDAVGTVSSIGSEVSLFRPGDRVWYSGSIHLPGSNAEYQRVDERIVGRWPTNLGAAEAVVVPLTGVTAWEALFDRLRIDPSADTGRTLLVIGGAGGVGSIAIQLAARVAGLTVIASASRPETRAWCLRNGAHAVVDHSSLVDSVHASGHQSVDFILNCADTAGHWAAMAELISPEGRIAAIVEARSPVDLQLLMAKSATFAWENMSTRPMFSLPSMQRQHDILNELATLAEADRINTTLTTTLEGLSAATLRKAHAMIETGRTIGKIAVVY